MSAPLSSVPEVRLKVTVTEKGFQIWERVFPTRLHCRPEIQPTSRLVSQADFLFDFLFTLKTIVGL